MLLTCKLFWGFHNFNAKAQGDRLTCFYSVPKQKVAWNSLGTCLRKKGQIISRWFQKRGSKIVRAISSLLLLLSYLLLFALKSQYWFVYIKSIIQHLSIVRWCCLPVKSYMRLQRMQHNMGLSLHYNNYCLLYCWK